MADDEFKDKIRHVNIGRPSVRATAKVTTDQHDTHEVDVVEHWEDRQDVTVRPKTVRAKIRVEEP